MLFKYVISTFSNKHATFKNIYDHLNSDTKLNVNASHESDLESTEHTCLISVHYFVNNKLIIWK